MRNEAIETPDAPAAIGPYSQAVRAGSGRLVFLSGQIGLDPASGKLVAGGVVEQTHRVMRNLQAVLQEAGGTFQHIVKTTIFLQDLSDFAAVNEVYASYLRPPFPARATVQAARLPRDVAVEIDGIAVFP